MKGIRLEGTAELKIKRTEEFNEKSKCALYSSIFGCFIMVNTVSLLFLFITKNSVFKMPSIQVLLQSAYETRAQAMI